jgi:hypothetical protein
MDFLYFQIPGIVNFMNREVADRGECVSDKSKINTITFEIFDKFDRTLLFPFLMVTSKSY